MTQEELDALPDVGGGFGLREVEHNGKKVMAPFMSGFNGVMGMPPAGQPMAVIDNQGRKWRIGLVNGVLSKRLSSSQL